MLESKINARGQITLPKPIREALSLKPGDQVRYLVEEGRLMILPVRPITWLAGALKYDGPPKTLEEIQEGIAKAAWESARS